MVKKFFVFLSGLFFLFITSSYIHAASVDLTWAPPVDGGEVEGYVIYASMISGDYNNPDVVEITDDTETWGTVSGLDFRQTYYFIAKAYNSRGFSEASNEVIVEAYSDSYYDYDTKSAGGCFMATAAYGSSFKPQDTSITREIVFSLMIMMLTMAFGGYLVRRFRVHG